MEENSGDDQLYGPQVFDDRKPKIGMKFTSIDDAFSFYNQYAREAGFSARISNSKKNKRTNEVVWKQFVCFKEGQTDESRWNKQEKGDQSKKERARGEVRTGCKSRISIVKEQTGPNWVVSTLMELHNHPLSTPSKVHLLRSHRNISATKKALTQQFSQANIPTRINQVFQLPDKYILKRWTRDAKDGATYAMGEEDISDKPEKFLMSIHSRLSYKASLLIDDASLTDEGTKFLDEQFDYISRKIKKMNKSRTLTNDSQKKKTMDETLGIIDPSDVRTKGCRKRLKSSKEKSTSKTRQYHGCGQRGVSHDKRNCPNLHDGSTVDNQHNNDDSTNEEDFSSLDGSYNMCTTEMRSD